MTLDRALRWRHRMLKEPIEHQPKAVKDILEVQETHFKISRKGQRGGRADHKGRLSSDFTPVLVGRVRGPPCTLDKAKPADFHVQSENSCHERLKTWINYRLRGVASKYMPICLAWQRLRTWKEMSSAELISCDLGRQIINL